MSLVTWAVYIISLLISSLSFSFLAPFFKILFTTGNNLVPVYYHDSLYFMEWIFRTYIVHMILRQSLWAFVDGARSEQIGQLGGVQ